MQLDSAIFMVFLALVAALYWRLTYRAQNRFLLAASYFFYAWWDWRFLLLIAASTTVDYFAANQIASQTNPHRRRIILTAALGMNLCFLAYFKYFNFFLDSFATLAGNLGVHLPHTLWKIILPPAISFYTFQEVAYLVDVYQRKLEPSRSLTEYALFIAFFPHLIAGPIQRPGHLLPQVQRPRSFDHQSFRDGIFLILAGLLRKCVLADSCAQLANAAFDGHMGHTGWTTLIGAYSFAFQIYGDFSGYSDIARGSAQLLGFHFMVNFRQPYLATSLQDFWRRWHISLSTWLRDYLYIPLGGNRKGTPRTYLNLLVTMLLGGLWHGASWNFIVWGALHGAGLAAERAASPPSPTATYKKWLARIAIFQAVCLCWIFFRATTFKTAIEMLTALTDWQSRPTYPTAITYLVLLIAATMAIDLWIERSGEEYPTQHSHFRWQLTAATAAAFLVAFGAAYQSAQFVYFQF